MKIISLIILSMILFVSCEDKSVNDMIYPTHINLEFFTPTNSNIIIHIYSLSLDSSENKNTVHLNGGTYTSPEKLNYLFVGTGAYEAGIHSFTWDFKDLNGNLVSPGTYRFEAISDNYIYFHDFIINYYW